MHPEQPIPPEDNNDFTLAATTALRSAASARLEEQKHFNERHPLLSRRSTGQMYKKLPASM
jgi:hypothetical protein